MAGKATRKRGKKRKQESENPGAKKHEGDRADSSQERTADVGCYQKETDNCEDEDKGSSLGGSMGKDVQDFTLSQAGKLKPTFGKKKATLEKKHSSSFLGDNMSEGGSQAPTSTSRSTETLTKPINQRSDSVSSIQPNSGIITKDTIAEEHNSKASQDISLLAIQQEQNQMPQSASNCSLVSETDGVQTSVTEEGVASNSSKTNKRDSDLNSATSTETGPKDDGTSHLPDKEELVPRTNNIKKVEVLNSQKQMTGESGMEINPSKSLSSVLDGGLQEDANYLYTNAHGAEKITDSRAEIVECAMGDNRESVLDKARYLSHLQDTLTEIDDKNESGVPQNENEEYVCQFSMEGSTLKPSAQVSIPFQENRLTAGLVLIEPPESPVIDSLPPEGVGHLFAAYTNVSNDNSKSGTKVTNFEENTRQKMTEKDHDFTETVSDNNASVFEENTNLTERRLNDITVTETATKTTGSSQDLASNGTHSDRALNCAPCSTDRKDIIIKHQHDVNNFIKKTCLINANKTASGFDSQLTSKTIEDSMTGSSQITQSFEICEEPLQKEKLSISDTEIKPDNLYSTIDSDTESNLTEADKFENVLKNSFEVTGYENDTKTKESDSTFGETQFPLNTMQQTRSDTATVFRNTLVLEEETKLANNRNDADKSLTQILTACVEELRHEDDILELTDSQLCQFEEDMIVPEVTDSVSRGSESTVCKSETDRSKLPFGAIHYRPTGVKKVAVNRPNTVAMETKKAEGARFLRGLINDLSSMNKQVFRFRRDMDAMKKQMQDSPMMTAKQSRNLPHTQTSFNKHY